MNVCPLIARPFEQAGFAAVTMAVAMALILASRLVRGQESSAPPVEDTAPPSLMELSTQAAELLESAGPTDDVTRRQQAIVDALSKMLQGAKSMSASVPLPVASARPGATSSGRSSPGAGTSQSGDARAERQPEGSESSGADSAPPPDMNAPITQRERLVEAVWGHLPPRLRDELYRSYTDRFVPEYSPQLKRYFEILAEQSGAKGQRKSLPPLP